jgi:microcin C transport system substrate-binding protein
MWRGTCRLENRKDEDCPMRMLRRSIGLSCLALGLGLTVVSSDLGAQEVKPVHGFAMHGAPRYPANFQHFDYADPNAPKGGEVRYGDRGSFDNLNPFILKGTTARGVGQIFDTLMVHSFDEPFSEYGLVAETIKVPPDRNWVAFNLRKEARFQDGTPITAADVVWTFETLKTKGHPRYRSYYHDVLKAEAVSDHRVKFSFAEGENRELPLIVGELPVLSKAYYAKQEFDKTTLDAPLGSGPYKVKAVNPGRSLTMERDPNYWGRDLPVNRGRFNFGTIRYEYYRDENVQVEALKGGDYDFRAENVARLWSTAYDTPAVAAGNLKKEELPNEVSSGMQSFTFNLRRPIFQDRTLRQALAYAFDFEWSNKTLFYGLYTRTASYFANSELASRGLPSDDELKILEPLRADLPPEVFTQEYKPPSTDGTGGLRDNLATALKLLKDGGWEVRNNKLTNVKTGQVAEFEILLGSPAFERIALPFAKNLERLGVTAKVRNVDPTQYQKRVENFDFDMTDHVFAQSQSPGNEQRDFWGSANADIQGSQNLIGIKNKAIDKLVELVIAAPDRESLVTRTRALDRALLWGHYVIPQWHSRAYRVVYWNMFGRPQTLPKFGLALDTWWIDQAKLAALPRRGSQSQ